MARGGALVVSQLGGGCDRVIPFRVELTVRVAQRAQHHKSLACARYVSRTSDPRRPVAQREYYSTTRSSY